MKKDKMSQEEALQATKENKKSYQKSTPGLPNVYIEDEGDGTNLHLVSGSGSAVVAINNSTDAAALVAQNQNSTGSPFKINDYTGNKGYVFPNSVGTADQVLQISSIDNDGDATLSWSTIQTGTGDVTGPDGNTAASMLPVYTDDSGKELGVSPFYLPASGSGVTQNQVLAAVSSDIENTWNLGFVDAGTGNVTGPNEGSTYANMITAYGGDDGKTLTPTAYILPDTNGLNDYSNWVLHASTNGEFPTQLTWKQAVFPVPNTSCSANMIPLFHVGDGGDHDNGTYIQSSPFLLNTQDIGDIGSVLKITAGSGIYEATFEPFFPLIGQSPNEAGGSLAKITDNGQSSALVIDGTSPNGIYVKNTAPDGLAGYFTSTSTASGYPTAIKAVGTIYGGIFQSTANNVNAIPLKVQSANTGLASAIQIQGPTGNYALPTTIPTDVRQTLMYNGNSSKILEWVTAGDVLSDGSTATIGQLTAFTTAGVNAKVGIPTATSSVSTYAYQANDNGVGFVLGLVQSGTGAVGATGGGIYVQTASGTAIVSAPQGEHYALDAKGRIATGRHEYYVDIKEENITGESNEATHKEAIDTFKKLDFWKYTRSESSDKKVCQNFYGVLAEDLKKVMPESVNLEGHHTINKSDLYDMALVVIQNLLKRIEKLEKKVF